MFITCNTWRQASYPPDSTFTALFTANTRATSSGIEEALGTSVVTASQITHAVSTLQIGVAAIVDLPSGTMLTQGTSVTQTSSLSETDYVNSQITLTFHSTGTATGSGTGTSSILGTLVGQGISWISSIGATMVDFHGQTTITQATTVSSTSFLESTASGTTSKTSPFGTAFNSTASWAASSSTFSSGPVMTTALNTTTTNNPVIGTSIASTVTSTTSTTHAFTSTSTASIARSIWTVNSAHAATTTTATASTTVTTITSASFSGATTATTTTATPSWWGWSSERGTLLIATGNPGTADLPAWLEKSNFTNASAIPALWNYTFTTQTTLWPSQPSSQVAGIAAINSNAIGNTTFVSLVTATTFTLFGTSTISFTTTSSTAAAPFTDTVDPFYTTAGFPISTISLTITSYTTSSSTITGFVTHGFNTTHSTSIQGFTVDIFTLIVGSTTFASTLGTYTTTATVTTLTSGYTTASMATGNGLVAVSSTTILTAPQISLTTTTMSLSFWYNSNSPTVISSSSSSSQSSTTGINGVATSTVSGITLAGFTSNFLYNVFSAPYVMFSPEYSLTSLAAGTLAVYAAPAVTWWAGTPTMQGFSPMSGGSTYQAIQGPASAIAAFMPAATGPVLNFLSAGGANTSTAWGVWQLVAVPNTATITSSVTTTGSPSTTATTYTVIGNFSFGYAASNASGTTANTILFGNPSVESDATVIYAITATMTSTVSTAGIPTSVSTTTTSSGSTSVSTGFALGSAVTSTFAESFGYLSTSTGIKTISSIGGITYTTGVATSATKSYFFITTLAVTATDFFTTSWNPANTSSVPTQLLAPGVGGYAKISTDGETIYINGAAVSYFAGSTFTWSTAAPNFMKIVVGGTLTTSSSTTTTAGALAATFTVYSLPGQGSLLTSPLSWISTHQDKWTPADLTQTGFWQTPAPYSTPNNVINR